MVQKMRIAFVFSQDLNKPSGVLEKYSAMVDIWQAQGHKVDLFALSDPPQGRSPFRSGTLHPISRPVPGPNKVVSFLRYFRSIQVLTKNLETISADVVYMRDLSFAPSFVSMMRTIPTVLELNTVNKREQRLTMSKVLYLYNRLTEVWMMKLSRGIVAVTNEIAESVSHYRRPTQVIPNGFDLARVAPPPAGVDKQKSMIFVGTPGYAWHGVDKIVELAQRLPSWHFKIIGYTQNQLSASAPANLQSYGLLPPQQYIGLLKASSVAIGTLALHRIEMHESCSLKVREYLAHGIPVLLGNKDTDFPDDRWFLKVLPNCESNVTDRIDEIQLFAESVDGKRVQHQEIGHIDHITREPERLAFLASHLGL